MLNHIVFFKLADYSPEQAQEVRERLLGLAGKIPCLRYLEVGLDVLHSERSYDLVLITRFDTLEDMQAYQVHPAHVEAARYIASVCRASATVDYESPA